MKVLVTGGAGFIGAHFVRRLLLEGHEVCSLDNFNAYYSPKLKEDRVDWVKAQAGWFPLHVLDLVDKTGLLELFADFRPEVVVHLAAQAGVRYSLECPDAYLASNLTGFLNILEACRQYPVRHLIYASSSSVYGASNKVPYKESDNTDHPLSLYAATKKSNEALAHSYAHLFGIPCSGLRFFTVYGPWGRPDMSPVLFAKAIAEGKPLKLFNHGQHRRDFTHVDDIIESMVRLLDKPPAGYSGQSELAVSSSAPWRLFNIGGQRPVELLHYAALLEKLLGRPASIEKLPLQPGDVLETCADSSELERVTGFSPQISLEEGLSSFVEWFCSYYM